MNNNKEIKCLKVMELAIKFIRSLTDNELDNLISGDLKFDIQKKKNRKASSKSTKKEDMNIDEESKLTHIVNKLNKSENREEAIEYIKSLKFTNEKLIRLGVKLGIKISRSYKKDKIINIIVEETVGTKLKIEGLRKGIMGRNSL